MAIKTVVICDGKNCTTEEVFFSGHFELGDLPTIDWSLDSDNEIYYCPSCTERLRASGELNQSGLRNEKNRERHILMIKERSAKLVELLERPDCGNFEYELDLCLACDALETPSKIIRAEFEG